MRRPEGLLVSEEGKILGERAWTEMVDVLQQKVPDIAEVVASLDGSSGTAANSKDREENHLE